MTVTGNFNRAVVTGPCILDAIICTRLGVSSQTILRDALATNGQIILNIFDAPLRATQLQLTLNNGLWVTMSHTGTAPFYTFIAAML